MRNNSLLSYQIRKNDVLKHVLWGTGWGKVGYQRIQLSSHKDTEDAENSRFGIPPW